MRLKLSSWWEMKLIIKIQAVSNKNATVQTLLFPHGQCCTFSWATTLVMWSGLWSETYHQHEICGRKTFLLPALDLMLFHLVCWIGRKAAASSLLCKCSRQAAEGVLQLWFDVMLSEIPTLHCHPSYTPHQPAATSVVLVQLLQQKTPLTKTGIPVVILKMCIWRALCFLRVFFFKLGNVFLSNKYKIKFPIQITFLGWLT